MAFRNCFGLNKKHQNRSFDITWNVSLQVTSTRISTNKLLDQIREAHCHVVYLYVAFVSTFDYLVPRTNYSVTTDSKTMTWTRRCANMRYFLLKENTKLVQVSPQYLYPCTNRSKRFFDCAFSIRAYFIGYYNMRRVLWVQINTYSYIYCFWNCFTAWLLRYLNNK